MTIRPSWCGITHWIMLKPRRHEPWTAASADGGSMRVVSNQQITADCRSLKTQNPPGGAGVSAKPSPGCSIGADLYRHCLPVRLSRVGCSFQFGGTSTRLPPYPSGDAYGVSVRLLNGKSYSPSC